MVQAEVRQSQTQEPATIQMYYEEIRDMLNSTGDRFKNLSKFYRTWDRTTPPRVMVGQLDVENFDLILDDVRSWSQDDKFDLIQRFKQHRQPFIQQLLLTAPRQKSGQEQAEFTAKAWASIIVFQQSQPEFDQYLREIKPSLSRLSPLQKKCLWAVLPGDIKEMMKKS